MTEPHLPFSTILRRLRDHAGLTRPALAEAAGLSTQALHGLESGRTQPRWQTVCRLADALHVSTDAFR